MTPARTLDQQRQEFSQRRFLATPLAGMLVWVVVAIGGALLPTFEASMLLFAATGSVLYIGIILSRFTGENTMSKNKPKNVFDGLFLTTVAMALLVYAVAIPFFMLERTSLPLSVGVLTGIMWLPLSWIIGHWIGIFHAVARTLLVTGAWLAFPDQRFVIVPLVIVLTYAVSIVVLEKRWRALALTPA